MSHPAHELPTRLHDAAAAIANARAARRGAPSIANILEILPAKLFREVVEDAQAALDAASAVVSLPLTPSTSDAEIAKAHRIAMCALAAEKLGSQVTVLLDVAADGEITVSTWAREPGTPALAIAEWANGLWRHALTAVPFRTVFGWGNGGVPLPLTPEERASLAEAGRAYADRNTQEPTP